MQLGTINKRQHFWHLISMKQIFIFFFGNLFHSVVSMLHGDVLKWHFIGLPVENWRQKLIREHERHGIHLTAVRLFWFTSGWEKKILIDLPSINMAQCYRSYWFNSSRKALDGGADPSLIPLSNPSDDRGFTAAWGELTPSVFLRDAASGSHFCPPRKNYKILECIHLGNDIPNIHNSLDNEGKGFYSKNGVFSFNMQWFINRTRVDPDESW